MLLLRIVYKKEYTIFLMGLIGQSHLTIFYSHCDVDWVLQTRWKSKGYNRVVLCSFDINTSYYPQFFLQKREQQYHQMQVLIMTLKLQKIQMLKKGRSQDQALLRTVVNKKYQTYSHKRLLKDLQEMENEKVPTVGVTARPLESNLFTWHANLRGPEGTLYEGGVFHLEMVFPLTYPHHPPTITIFNPIPHPNVFDNYICLDMIMRGGKREEGQGWSSAYTVQSILSQLQSFLFQQNLTHQKETLQLEIKKAVSEANSFKCRTCKHGGKLSCWPQFSDKEAQIKQFKLNQQQNALLQKQLLCFHTKLPYKENQLGLGLKITKIPRTGNISEAETYYDYISVKAYLKESVRHTSLNERITHWMPVYFGKGDNEERWWKFFRKAMSMIMTNSTRNFRNEQILQVLPKLMVTIIYYIMDEKKHPSVRNIRLLTHIHSMFLYALKKVPQLQQTIKETLQKFLQSEQNRTKQNQSNLGCILAYLSGVSSHKFSQVAQAYFLEQLDRQVLWILKAVPELLDDSIQEDVDREKARVVFRSQMTSFHIFCFYRMFIGDVCEGRKDRQQMLDEYHNNLCKLTNKQQEHFQQKIIQIKKKVTNFSQFFKYIGLKQRNQNQIIEMLKKAIKNSERKKYHGEFQTLNQLPNSHEQFQKIWSKVPSYKEYFEITQKGKQMQEKEKDKKQSGYIIKQKQSTQENWRKMCTQRWFWIKQAIAYQKDLTSQQVSSRATQFAEKGILKSQDRLIKIVQNYKNEHIDYKIPCIQLPQISWKQLFLRLDLQDFLLYFDMNPDFGTFYEKLQLCRYCQLNTLVIPLVPIKKIKSGYFYLTSLLGKLSTLKYLEFLGLPQGATIGQKCAKALQKGLNNFTQLGGSLLMVVFHKINCERDKDYSQYLFECLKPTHNLRSLRLSSTDILSFGNANQILSKRIGELTHLQQLVFDECTLNEQRCKTIADVLMRAKKLRIFRIHNKQDTEMGLSSLIYNISFFSPDLQMLDISRCQSNMPETVVSLRKMINITTSLEVLLIKNIPNFNPTLVESFWKNVGQCKSLRVLDISHSGHITRSAKQLGNAIAFNAKNKGVLQYVNLTSCFTSIHTFYQMYKGMCISEYDEEKIYGSDPAKLEKMIQSNYERNYYNNLKALQFDFCGSLNPASFNLAYFNKLIGVGDTKLVKIMARSEALQNISMSKTSLGKAFAEMLSLAIDPRRPNFKTQLKVLNLAKNGLGKEGIKAISKTLCFNQILEVLDVSKNEIGVMGAIQLAGALKNNKSLRFLNIFNNNVGYDGAKSIAQNIIGHHPRLECLEIGHNRIRDKGAKQIIDSVIANKNSSLKFLGLRFNFITNTGATNIYTQLTNTKTKIQQLFLSNNLVQDAAIDNLHHIRHHEASNIYIDIFSKLKYTEQERLERTVWIHPIQNINLHLLKQFFEVTQNCGIVLEARVRRAKQYPIKNGENIFGFVQFADRVSVNRALFVASQKLACVDGVKFRVYRAGTGTFIYAKKTGKEKKLQESENMLAQTPYDQQVVNLNMRRPMRMEARRVGPIGRNARPPRIPAQRGRADRQGTAERRPRRDNARDERREPADRGREDRRTPVQINERRQRRGRQMDERRQERRPVREGRQDSRREDRRDYRNVRPSERNFNRNNRVSPNITNRLPLPSIPLMGQLPLPSIPLMGQPLGPLMAPMALPPMGMGIPMNAPPFNVPQMGSLPPGIPALMGTRYTNPQFNPYAPPFMPGSTSSPPQLFAFQPPQMMASLFGQLQNPTDSLSNQPQMMRMPMPMSMQYMRPPTTTTTTTASMVPQSQPQQPQPQPQPRIQAITANNTSNGGGSMSNEQKPQLEDW